MDHDRPCQNPGIWCGRTDLRHGRSYERLVAICSRRQAVLLLQPRQLGAHYIRSAGALSAGAHTVGFEFEKTGPEQFGAGGTGRLLVDGRQVAEGGFPRTAAYGYSLDETFDVGCEKGSPVTDEYEPLAVFTGCLVKVTSDLQPTSSETTKRAPTPT
jgi:hypothetical protein